MGTQNERTTGSREGAIGTFAACLEHARGALSEQDFVALRRSFEQEIQERTGRMRAWVTTMTLTEQEERRRISRVLHDDLQQVLFGIQVVVVCLREGTADDAKRERWVCQAHDWVTDAISITKRLTLDCSPPVLHDDGVAEALGWLADHMEQTHGLHVDIEPPRLPEVPLGPLEQMLYQVVRELLFNVVQHAQTDHARVSLEIDGGSLVLRVIDHGRGFDPGAQNDGRASQHLGLFRARERLGLFGGSLDIDSEPGNGTRIVLRVPCGTERV